MIQNINLPEVKEDIVKRLEKLNKWQEEQKKLLHERQNMQRQMLGLEQRKMYENLGILEPEDEDETEYSIQCPRKTNDDECSMSAHDDELSEDEDYTEATNTCTETKRTSGYCTEDVQNSASPTLKPKKPFLRRGEGLKQRFKIDPDALRLNNLPHYKYANAHPHLNNNNSTSKPSKKVMKPTTKVKVNKTKSIDSQEKRFQQMLISSENLCNSTPDVKSTSAASMQSLLPKVRFVDNEVNIKTSNIRLNKEQEDSSCGTEFTSPQPVSWAKVLDSQQIKPLPVQTFRYTPDLPERQGPDPDENLSIFEMLEQKANEGSIDLNSTPIRQFMLKKIEKVQDNDEIPVANRLHSAGILPKVAEIDENLNESEEDGEDGVSTIFDTEYDDTTITPDKPTRNKSRIKVRFSEENETQEYEEEGSETSNAAVDESSSLYMFQQFKQALFSALQPKGNDSNCTMTTTNADELSGQWLGRSENSVLTEDLQLKMNLIKTRLAELEKEISTFKENNVHLIKAKQAHELEKAHFAQEQLEAMDKLNDEKIQMEIYFHDERMNIEDEKRKLERQIQMHKTSANSKDRKEIARLKNEIEEMQAQIKQKEQMHVAAQARLRAQIRTLEKDQKQLYDDIERLTKENKRLQNENLKISRENNNKMLQEINRNIAKLAPKLSSAPIDEERTRPVKESTKVSSKPKADKRHILHKSKPKAKVTHDALSLSECENRASELISCFDGDYDENEEDALELSKEIKGVQSNLKNVQFADSLKKSKPTSETNVNDTTNELKREIINSDGSKDIWYPNGNLKKISADEMIIRMLYFNKDIKETNINEGTVKYYYAESNTWHTTYLDGLEILEFPNGQTEHRYKNGIVEVHFPNNSIKVTNPADEHKLEEWRFADGTNLIHMRNGDKILMLPDGQKEIHTKLNKRREYPDGTVKLVYPDGSQETRYSNGRVRLKDKDGKLVMDSEHAT